MPQLVAHPHDRPVLGVLHVLERAPSAGWERPAAPPGLMLLG